MVKHCDSFVNPVCDIREGLNLKNKISIRLNLGGGVVTVQLKCLLKQSGQANEWPILTEYGHETPLSKLVAANEQKLAHFSIDGTPN